MRRTVLFLAAFVLMISALAVPLFASDTPYADTVSISRDSVVPADATHVTGKRAALEAAHSKVESGEAPEQIDYFTDENKYRTVNDGYYTVTLAGSDKCFNVDADGAGSDYEGIRITVWQVTDDVTQRFRIVMNDNGTYTIYAACSHGGYNRVVGYNRKTGSVGLYSTSSQNAATFYIRNSKDNDGAVYLVLSSDETKYLACTEKNFNGKSVTLENFGNEGFVYDWNLATWGVSSAVKGTEKAMYPAELLLVTQGPFEKYSHKNQNATDIQTAKGDSLFAPFTAEVVNINKSSGNVVWLQSVNKVLYADGTYDYMTCLFMHDNDISDIYLGEIIMQGQDFYEMGTAGYAKGRHVHISCYRGEYSKDMKIENNGDTAVNIWDAFFLAKDIKIKDAYKMPWVWDEK